MKRNGQRNLFQKVVVLETPRREQLIHFDAIHGWTWTWRNQFEEDTWALESFLFDLRKASLFQDWKRLDQLFSDPRFFETPDRALREILSANDTHPLIFSLIPEEKQLNDMQDVLDGEFPFLSILNQSFYNPVYELLELEKLFSWGKDNDLLILEILSNSLSLSETITSFSILKTYFLLLNLKINEKEEILSRLEVLWGGKSPLLSGTFHQAVQYFTGTLPISLLVSECLLHLPSFDIEILSRNRERRIEFTSKSKTDFFLFLPQLLREKFFEKKSHLQQNWITFKDLEDRLIHMSPLVLAMTIKNFTLAKELLISSQGLPADLQGLEFVTERKLIVYFLLVNGIVSSPTPFFSLHTLWKIQLKNILKKKLFFLGKFSGKLFIAQKLLSQKNIFTVSL
jgi:hypothetical protein